MLPTLFDSPRSILRQEGTVIDPINDHTTFTLATGALKENVSFVNLDGQTVTGVRAVSASGVQLRLRKTTLNVNYNNATHFCIEVHVIAPNTAATTTGVTGAFILSPNSSFATFKQANISLNFGRQLILLSRADFADQGGVVDWNQTFTTFQLTIDAVAGVAIDVYVTGFKINEIYEPILTLDCDDARSGIYDIVFPFMVSNAPGMCFNLPVIGNTVGSAGFCNASQINEMVAAGICQITNHTLDHTSVSLATGTSAYWRSQITGNVDKLVSLGIAPGFATGHLDFPFGLFNSGCFSALQDLNMTGRGNFVPAAANLSHPAHTNLKAGRNLLMANFSIINTHPLASVTAALERHRSAGRPVNLLIHDAKAVETVNLDWSTSKWQGLITYLRDSWGVNRIVNRSDYNRIINKTAKGQIR